MTSKAIRISFLIMLAISVALTQNRNYPTTLRERLQMTKDYSSKGPNLAKRLGCPFMPVVDNVTVVGKVLDNNRVNDNPTHAKLVGWMNQLKDCDHYEKEDDLDLTFTVNSLTSDSQKLIWDNLGISNLEGNKIEAELVPCAQDVASHSIFPGWRDAAMNVMFKDLNESQPRPFWRGTADDAASSWERIKNKQCLSVRGALVIDAGDNCEGPSRYPEIHPVYEIRLLPDSACP